jgi:hypothetical protein
LNHVEGYEDKKIKNISAKRNSSVVHNVGQIKYEKGISDNLSNSLMLNNLLLLTKKEPFHR